MKRAGTLQGILLILPITMAVMGVVVLAPVVPKMEAQFGTNPLAGYLVPLAPTIPSLAVGLLSGFAGMLVDWCGRRRTLILGLLAYAVIGLIPAFVNDLAFIVAARFALGATEAAIIISSTTLIGDYFEGREREKWLSAQLAIASCSAVGRSLIGGLLGELSWRAPFGFYLVSLVYAALLARWTWEPDRQTALAWEGVAERFPWRRLPPLIVAAAAGAVVVFALQVQLPLLLSERYAIASPTTIGFYTAAGSLAVPFGTFTYRAISRWRTAFMLGFALALIGGSYLALGRAPSGGWLLVPLVISQYGCGILAPALVVWAMAPLSFRFRGRGTGLFMSAWWIGQFLAPQIILMLRSGTGSLPAAIQLLGVLVLAAAGVALLTRLSGSNQDGAA